ncbi:MAG: UDP-N-acetylmuramoyl-L-alanine--D-glutamate ligase [Candidatus Lambdaproteobacteria bacterium]|nr:UDP-N-acetylmuramoyl-L-alanine--D-glutamate ligase [Candidatus Lambdaproteobacteria bacterium]
MFRAISSISDYVAALPRPLALLGFGVEGRETLRFLLGHGAGEAHVYDHAFASGLPAQDVRAQFAGAVFHGEADWARELAAGGTVLRSAGVRPDVPELQAARAAGARVLTAVGMFLALRPGPVVGVTGTLGKGTTVTLIGQALAAAGVPHRLGGNIGLNPLAFLDELTARDVSVLELSSFQLMDLAAHQPDVAVVLRTSSEHLDWHRDVGEYRRAKRGLLAPAGSGQRVIYCADSAGSREVVAGHEAWALAVSLSGPVDNGIGLHGGRLCRMQGGTPEALPWLEALAMPGAFNRENAAAAALAAECVGAGAAPAARAIAAFPGLPHRLERVGLVGGVACYNDSYATRPDATLGAVHAFAQPGAQPLVLIAGGSEKHADFAGLMDALCRHGGLREIELIGATAERMAQALADAAARAGVPVPAHRLLPSLEEAFAQGLRRLNGEGVLLLSPACASFGLFANYTARGERFRALVHEAAHRPAAG